MKALGVENLCHTTYILNQYKWNYKNESRCVVGVIFLDLTGIYIHINGEDLTLLFRF